MYFLNKKCFVVLLIVAVVVIFSLITGNVFAQCNMAIATGKATKDGSNILAKNSTRGDDCQWLAKYPGGTHEAGEMVKCSWIEIPQAPITYAVTGGQPWWGYGFEQGMNEFGVSAGNVAVHYRSGAPVASKESLTGMDLLRLALERGKTASEAVQVLIDLYQKYGGNGLCHPTAGWIYCSAYAFVDPNEAWVVELPLNGYIAYKLPKDGVYGMSNIVMIETQYDIISPNLIQDAIDQGWHEEGEEFNFAYSYLAGDAYDDKSEVKLERVRGLLKENSGNIDPFVMAEIFKDRKEGDWLETRFMPYQFQRNLDETNASQANAGTMIAHLRKGLPDSIANVYWYGIGSGCASPVTPIYWGGTVPEEYCNGEDVFDSNSPWWVFHILYRMSLKNYDAFSNVVKSVWKPVEEQNFREAAMLEKKVIKLTDEGKDEEIKKLLTDFHRSEMNNQLNIAKGTAKALQELYKVYPGRMISVYPNYESMNIRAGVPDLFEIDW